MATVVVPIPRRPPPLYRAARLFRRLSAVVLVLVLIYVGTSLYSASRFAESKPSAGGYSASVVGNDTVEIAGSLQITNPGFYSVDGLRLSLRVLNDTGGYLGASVDGPVNLVAGSTTEFPIDFYVTVSANAPAASLLTSDQTLSVATWGNATYAYLIPFSVHFDENETWGAPFADLSVAPGVPQENGGTTLVPVTVRFEDHSPIADDGQVTIALDSAGGNECGGGTFSLAVDSGGGYDETQDISLATGCSLMGGHAAATYTTDGSTISFPSQELS